MVKITLEPARNGIIKKTFDYNHGGSSNEWTSTDVYESNETSELDYIKRFFFDLCEDLSVNLGNEFSKEVINITTGWGVNYKPTKKDIQQKIKELEEQIQVFKEWETS